MFEELGLFFGSERIFEGDCGVVEKLGTKGFTFPFSKLFSFLFSFF